MATITLSLDTTLEQDAALAWLLTITNSGRAGNGLKPHTDAAELLTVLLLPLLDGYLTQYQAAQSARVTEALRCATPDECAKVAEILKCEWP